MSTFVVNNKRNIIRAWQSQLNETGLSQPMKRPFSVCADGLDLQRSMPTYHNPSRPYQTFTTRYRLPKTLAKQQLIPFIVDRRTLKWPEHTATGPGLVKLLWSWTQLHRRSQDFVWGCIFSTKGDDLFLVVALKDRLNIPPKTVTRPAKTVLKIDSRSGWGCTSCPGGALTHFPCKLRLKNFFPPPWGCRCTHGTPWLRLCLTELML